ncbi:MAG: DNA polymerase III subunit beta [Blastomonas sp.]
MARGNQAGADDRPAVKTDMVCLPAGSLKAALKSVITAVEARNTIPILSNVLITVTPQHLTVCGTDLDVEITRQVPVTSASGSWGITVRAHVLDKAVDKLAPGKAGADAEVTISVADGRLKMACGRARFDFPTLPVADFPHIACGDWDAQWEMPGSTLAEMLAHCRPAASTEETRYYLNGVFFERNAAELIAVATDGHRLHTVCLPAPDGSEPLKHSIVPRKAAAAMAALCAEARVELAFSPGKVRMDSGETVMTAKLIDGTFPDWRRVVPSAADKSCEFDPRAGGGAGAGGDGRHRQGTRGEGGVRRG